MARPVARIAAALLAPALVASASAAAAGPLDLLTRARVTDDSLALATPAGELEAGFDGDGRRLPVAEQVTLRTHVRRTRITLGLASDLGAPAPRDLLAPADGPAALGEVLEAAHGLALAHDGAGPDGALAFGRAADGGRPLAAGRLELGDAGQGLALHAGAHGGHSLAGALARMTPLPDLRVDAGLAVQHSFGRPAGTLGGARITWDAPFGTAGRLTATVRRALAEAGPQVRLSWTAHLPLGALSLDGRTATEDDPARLAAAWEVSF
jgi:hypothetical protein